MSTSVPSLALPPELPQEPVPLDTARQRAQVTPTPASKPASTPVTTPPTPPVSLKQPPVTPIRPENLSTFAPMSSEPPVAAPPTQQDTAPVAVQDRVTTSVADQPIETVTTSDQKPDPVRDDQVMVETEATTEGYRASDLRTILEWLAVIIAALLVALVIKTFVLQAFWIPSESMETTVNEGDRILVNKVSYKLHEVRRGDLVVFAKLEGTPGDTPDLIKRAIALPGETIEVRADGRIWIWGPGETPEDAKLLQEPYLDPQNAILAAPSATDPTSQSVWNDSCVNQQNPGRCTLDENSFFMMGDNRFRSLDSRSFGPVPAENIVGRAFLRIWPPGDISTL